MMISVNENNLVERKESMKIRQEASRYAMLVLGAAILAFGLYNVHSQSHITEGGVLGMTLDGMLPAEEESAPESVPASESGSVSAASAAD